MDYQLTLTAAISLPKNWNSPASGCVNLKNLFLIQPPTGFLTAVGVADQVIQTASHCQKK